VRALDSLAADALPGTEGASYPFWSPDSQFVGFFAQRKLKKVEATGGPVQTLCDAVLPRGGTWNRADVILFSADAGQQLFRVPAAGGQATPVALDQPNRESHSPDFLPDGRHFVYHARRQKPGIYLASLDSRDTKLLATGYMAVDYAAPGYLLLLAGGPQSETAGTLVAQRFDTRELQLVGEPIPIAEQVAIRPQFSRGVFSTSENGKLVYGTSRQQVTQLIWRDREGKQLGTVAKPGRYERAALSADEKTVAAEIIDRHVQTPDIWLIETTRGVTSRFTSDAGAERMPLWSPDGSRIVFSSPREGNPPNLFQKTSSGAGAEELLFRSDLIIQPTDWSRDGRFIVYARRDPKTQWDLWVVPATPIPANGDRKPVLYLQTQFNEHAGHFSADGRWMAYSSDESGRWEVYVRAFPSGGARWQISTDGGVEPRWGRDGKELFYVAPDGTLMTVAVQLAEFQASVPRALFKTRFAAFGADRWRPEYAPAGGGHRFLVNTLVDETEPLPVTILLNWPAVFSRH
jgi:eukaryotic-like serine/threonine-protein kinase